MRPDREGPCTARANRNLTNGFERGMKRRCAGMKGKRAIQHMNFQRKYGERKP